jgi:hypothetical protein
VAFQSKHIGDGPFVIFFVYGSFLCVALNNQCCSISLPISSGGQRYNSFQLVFPATDNLFFYNFVIVDHFLAATAVPIWERFPSKAPGLSRLNGATTLSLTTLSITTLSIMAQMLSVVYAERHK